MTKPRKIRSPRTIAYGIWQHMHGRCYKPGYVGYRHYGGRGITVCERWHSFKNFYEDMFPRPDGLTMDRKDGNLGYSPENCRWATWDEQVRNRNCNVIITFNGKTQCSKDWADELGINYKTLHHRLKSGWLPEIALTMPTSANNAQFRLASRAVLTGGKINQSVRFANACKAESI